MLHTQTVQFPHGLRNPRATAVTLQGRVQAVRQAWLGTGSEGINCRHPWAIPLQDSHKQVSF